MSDRSKNGFTRRQFHGASAATLSLPLTGARLSARAPRRSRDEAPILIVLELVGGSDGLNTVIPAADPRYRRARPRLSSVIEGAHAIDKGLSLHPALTEVHQLYERGEVTIVQGVGITPPDRSHFRSRDIWHTGDPTLDKVTAKDTGWLGRLGDSLLRQGTETPSMALGQSRLPLCLLGKGHTPPLLNDPEALRLKDGADPEGAKVVIGGKRSADPQPEAGLEGFLGGLADQARALEQRLQRAFEGYTPKARFLNGDGGALGRSLASIVRLIAADFGTRLFHVPLDGFDTHSRQEDAHRRLLRAVSQGLGALVAELRAIGALERTTIFVHSEFGRRVTENESAGTDHGAGAPCLVVGGGVRGGLLGDAPDLSSLLDGDIPPTTDFRSLHCSFVQRLGVPVDQVLDLEERDRGIEPIPLFS